MNDDYQASILAFLRDADGKEQQQTTNDINDELKALTEVYRKGYEHEQH